MSQHRKHRPVPRSELVARLRSAAAPAPERATAAVAERAAAAVAAHATAAVAVAEAEPTRALVPTRRRSGWTVERQRMFLKLLAQTGSIQRSADMVGMSVSSAYRLRAHPAATAFRAAWSATIMHCVVTARDAAFERVLSGATTPIMKNGEVKGTRIVYSDKLLMFMLRNYDFRVNDYDAPNIEGRFVAQLEALVDMPDVPFDALPADD